MKINRKHLLFFLLITAYLNAVLRPSVDSNITAFRLLLPIAWIVIYSISNRVFTKIFIATILIIVLSFFQFSLAKYIFFTNVSTLTVIHLIEYLFHALCIITIIGIVYSLRVLYDEGFERVFIKFGSRFIRTIAVVYLIYIFRGGEPVAFLLFGNINDLGCVFVIGINLILFEDRKRLVTRIAWIAVLMALLLYNDSKLAFFGAVLEVGLYLIVVVSASTESSFSRIGKIVLVVIGILIVGVLFTSTITINGYTINEITIEPLRRALSGQFYSHSSSSQTFRVNVIIALLKIMRRSYLLGVGIGDAGLILKTIVPDTGMTFSKYTYMASHIWWLEVMVDLGWIAVIPMMRHYFSTWKKYIIFDKQQSQLFGLLFIISFPIWSMSSSGLYTEYFSLSMLAFAVLMNKQFRFEIDEI